MLGAVIFLAKLRAMFRLRHPETAAGNPELRPVVNELASAWLFAGPAIDVSPTEPGVYLLYRDGRLIYIGVAVNGASIRQELARHLGGARGDCTREATAFAYELTPDPRARYRRYLSMHRERHGGRRALANLGHDRSRRDGNL